MEIPSKFSEKYILSLALQLHELFQLSKIPSYAQMKYLCDLARKNNVDIDHKIATTWRYHGIRPFRNPIKALFKAVNGNDWDTRYIK